MHSVGDELGSGEGPSARRAMVAPSQVGWCSLTVRDMLAVCRTRHVEGG